MRGCLGLAAVVLLLAGCLTVTPVNAGAFLAAARRSLLHLEREGQEQARVAATVTAEAQREERPAPGLAPEEVLAALQQAGFQMEQLGEDCDDLSSWLGGPERCNHLETTVASVPYEVSVLSYRDAPEATRVARRVREIYQSTRGNSSAYAMSRGVVVVMVSPVDEGLVDRVRAVLESMP